MPAEAFVQKIYLTITCHISSILKKYQSYLHLTDSVPLPPVHKSPLLDHQPSPHVATVEITQLHKVIMNVDKTEDDGTDDAKAENDNDDIDFLLYCIVSEIQKYRSPRRYAN